MGNGFLTIPIRITHLGLVPLLIMRLIALGTGGRILITRGCAGSLKGARFQGWDICASEFAFRDQVGLIFIDGWFLFFPCRLDGKEMLELLRGKRLVFVGDSLNRNMWESLVCILRNCLEDKNRVFEVSGKNEFRTEGFYAFRFAVCDLDLDFSNVVA